MKVIYSEEHQKHNPEFEIYDGVKEPYAEKADRANVIVESLKSKKHEILEPKKFGLDNILSIHQPGYVDFIRTRSEQLSASDLLYPSYFISDTYAPISSGTYTAALSAVDVALTGAKLVTEGESVAYSLSRPPGHHSGYKHMGGYCYFNNAAIAANYLSSQGGVAILDIDLHHGNGTQVAFYDRADVLYVSLHADTKDFYPYSSGFSNEVGRGEGVGYNHNIPLPLGTSDKDYLKHLKKALTFIEDFKPDFLIVSAGFDTFKDDPIGGFSLSLDVYAEIGQMISDLKLPSLIVQEGGYNVESLGEMVGNFLSGFGES